MAELILDHNELKTFSPSDAAIAKMAEQYMGLTIHGIDDKKGFDIVHKARMNVKNHRVAVEKKRKELKADALEYGRKVDAEAKRLTLLLEPIETHLAAEEQAITDEKARIQREKEEAAQRVLDERVAALQAVGVTPSVGLVRAWSDEQYAEQLATATRIFEEEKAKAEAEAEERRKKEAEEAEARRKEEERLAAERAELERLRAEMEAQRLKEEEERRKEREAMEAELRKQEALRLEREAAEQTKLRAERAKLEEERRKLEMEQREREAAERSKQETEERLRREAEEKARKEAEEAAERARLEELRPDQEKLEALAKAVTNVPIPSFSPTQAHLRTKIVDILVGAASEIRELL